MSELYYLDFQSPIGAVEIIGTPDGISSVLFKEEDVLVHLPGPETPQVLMDCLKELTEYFKGERMHFTVPLISEGTEFQWKVWQALKNIRYAETASYREVADAVGSPKAVRAVGNANSKNKISIIVPCHRVIGSNGKLTGYAGSLSRKEWLLQHEQAVKHQQTIV
ncbi:methylated-DNA--[protein]-cysteine S-methyltransferase [Planococcus sp. YIM B11945]|uniref:methylated-DNA--[protein]-cysteine S-methyltransferase n=1 Tax=Planococcus sp. YIM B11945 TaxID=3435410 RepID=UPI003D7F0CF5